MLPAVLIAAVSIGGDPNIPGPSINWDRPYSPTRLAAIEAKRPLAIFVSSGIDGWKKVIREGRLNSETIKVLVRHYETVYVNQDTDDGRRVAEALELSGKTGLVIGDRTGELQAFRHVGDLANAEIVRHLSRYADQNHVVSTTESTAPKPVFRTISYPESYSNPFQFCPNGRG
jgi:hypothetical protein